jgi:hypothetical protein
MNPVIAPVIDWESDVGGVLMILLEPPVVEPTAEDMEDDDEDVDGAEFRWPSD